MKCSTCYGNNPKCLACGGAVYRYEQNRCTAVSDSANLLRCELERDHNGEHVVDRGEGQLLTWLSPPGAYRASAKPGSGSVVPEIAVEFPMEPFWIVTNGDLWVGKGGHQIVFERANAQQFVSKGDAQAALDRLGTEAKRRLHVLRIELRVQSYDETFVEAKSQVVAALQDGKR